MLLALIIIVVGALLMTNVPKKQDPYSYDALKAFVAALLPAAKQVEAATGYRAVLLLTLAALESGNGSSRFAQEGYNFFGMKGNPLKGPTMARASDGAQFRKYASALAGLLDHAELIMKRWPSNYGSAAALARSGDPSFFRALITAKYAYAEEKDYDKRALARYPLVLRAMAELGA